MVWTRLTGIADQVLESSIPCSAAMNLVPTRRRRVHRRWHSYVSLVILAASILIPRADADIFGYLKLKKLLTAVAFAKALTGGRRPTIVPVPIPIPIPIQQNEIIRIPSSGGGKTNYISLSHKERPSHQHHSIGSSIHGGSYGTSAYGYGGGGGVGGSPWSMLSRGGIGKKLFGSFSRPPTVRFVNAEDLAGEDDLLNDRKFIPPRPQRPYNSFSSNSILPHYGGEDLLNGYGLDLEPSMSIPPRVYPRKRRKRKRRPNYNNYNRNTYGQAHRPRNTRNRHYSNNNNNNSNNNNNNNSVRTNSNNVRTTNQQTAKQPNYRPQSNQVSNIPVGESFGYKPSRN